VAKLSIWDISYGLIVKFSKAVPVKGGRRKEKSQTIIAWDDEHATFLCRWFEPVLGESGHAREIGGKKAFVMPIHCAYGFNWEVHAKDGMVLCPVEMVWTEEEKSYLLNADHEKQANELALESVTRHDGSREHQFVGSAPPQPCSDNEVETGMTDDDDDDEIRGRESIKQTLE
jgi:hypothetical protein